MPFAKGRRADRQVYRLLGTQIAPRRCRGFAPARSWDADSAKYGGLMSAGDFWRGLTEPDVGVARLARMPRVDPLRSILIGALAAVAVLLIRAAASSFYSGLTGFMILLPGVIVAALAAGRVGGLSAMVVALCGGWWLVNAGSDTTLAENMMSALGRVATINFIIVSLFSTVVAASLRKTLQRLDCAMGALRESEARTNASESRLKVISEQAPTMLWMSDVEGRCVHLNQAQRAFWGVTEDAASFDFTETLHPDDRDRVLAVAMQAMHDRAPFEAEARYRRHDGQWRILLTRAHPRIDADGGFEGMVGVNTDVTDARLAEAALRASEAALKATVDQASAGIARVGLDGRIMTANARFANILGISEADAVGISTADVTHHEDIEPTRQMLEQALRGEGGQLEKRYIRPDGSVVWALTSLRVLTGENGQPEGFIAVVVDITDAKTAEAALRESEERFRLMADTAPSPVWLTNEAGEVEFVNDALVDFYRRPAEQIFGHAWRDSVHPDDQDEVARAQAEARPHHLPYSFETRFLRGDGAWRWMRVSVNPRFDAHKRFRGYVGMSFDITETREALEALATQERRQSFLLALTDRLRDLSDPSAIMDEVERSLGDLLDADRVGYGEVDHTRGMIELTRDWTAGVPSAAGRVTLETFGARLIEDLARGQVISIPDVREDPRTIDVARRFAEIETRALVRAPLIRAGRLQAYLYVHDSGVRHWTPAEISLVEEVAARTWAEVERARAEAEVRESEHRFRSIADTAPVLIWVTQENGERAFVNEAYVQYMGGDYETVRTADWRSYIHPDDQDRVLRESIAGEASAQPFSMEARYLRHDGRYHWLKSFSRPRLNAEGRVIGFVGVAFDVTDIREAQARLIESESRFRIVADSAPALIWMTDDSAHLIFANKRFQAFFGTATGDLFGEEWSAVTHPDDRADFARTFTHAFERRERFEAVVRVVHETQGVRWMRCEGVPRHDGEGVFQGFVGACLDVTDAKRAEDDLKRINELLEERVGEALAEKAQAEANLMHAQRMEAVGRLTGGVAHDFNNLLTVVIGALDMILRSPDDAVRRQKLGEAALAAARRGERLTHQLLAFSRRQALRPEVIDLNTLIREGEPLLRRAVGEAVQFSLKLRRGGARVKVDPAQFEAALLNLIVNARDAVGETGHITIRSQDCTVEDGETPEIPVGRYICVSVTDDGQGMPPEVIDRVFEPFFTTKAVGKGTGLGLSQVYGFAHQSGGGVKITSTVGEGTEVRLYLPILTEDRTLAAPTTQPEATGPRPSAKLLLVEDDPGVSAIAVDMLRGMKFKVKAVETAAEALKALSRQTFDVMLSDVVMPGGMTGIELARRCAVDYPDLRVVLTSGYAGDDVDSALKDAPWPLLRKPYSTEELKWALGGAPLTAPA